MHAHVVRVARRWLLGKTGGTKTERPSQSDNAARPLSDDPLFEKFLDELYQGGTSKIPNPNPDTREKWPTVSFQTALKDEGFRRRLSEQFERWKKDQKDDGGERPRRTEEEREKTCRPTRRSWGSEQEQDALLDMAKQGRMVDDDQIARNSANVTRKRALKLGDHEGDFIWKPAFGEDTELRSGIEAGTYHQREAATYNIDRLLGEDVVVPPTMSTGKGSYQAWADGAQTLGQEGASLSGITNEQLKQNKSFRRVALLDALLGHEDRHGNNLMFRWAGDEGDPAALRFDAIDNGLVLASPESKKSPDDYVVRMPWNRMAKDPGDETGLGRMKAVSDVLSEIDPELHDQLRGIKIEDFVKSLTKTGINDEKAILAAAVRLAALQEDAFALGEVIRDARGNPRAGVANFLYLSGHDPKKLLEYARAEDKLPEIEKAVRSAMAT